MSTIISEQSSTRPAPATGPVRCATWCEDGDGHASAMFAADQWCRSVEGRVVVSGAESWLMSDGSTRPASATVYTAQDPGEAPHVTIVNAQDQGMDLTPEEAREVARQLVHFAWVAEQDQRERNAFEIGTDHGKASA